MLSYVQLKILANALKGNALRYSELQPDEIEQDLFNYHLRFLLDKKYLKKEDELYFLTDFGKKYVIQMTTQGEYKGLFRVSVIAIAIRIHDEKLEILMQKRLRHPYYGDINIGISGKVEPSEPVIESAKRKLKEESNLDGEFKFIGVLRQIRKDKNGSLIEDTFYQICLCDNPTGEIEKSNDFGLNFWYELDYEKLIDLIKDNATFADIDKRFIQMLIKPPAELFFIEDFHTLNTI